MATRLSIRDSAAVVAEVVMPLFARGVIVRRPRIVGIEERIDADRRAVLRLRRIRDRYGPGPVLLRVPGREIGFVLSGEDVRRVLDGAPEPFSPANREKRAALSHFQPHGVLISEGGERLVRREFNEAVLESAKQVHRLAEAIEQKVREEAAAMLRPGSLMWDDFAVPWWRMVRRVVLGDGARDDHALTNDLTRLRGDANWAFLRPKRSELREAFLRRIDDHIARAEPRSLAALTASAASAGAEPAHQVAHWLFAFDAAGMASFRALALIDGHPGAGDTADRSFLRRAVLESLRLWPTTPAILRDTTAETSWDNGTLAAGTALVIFAPYFHRDPDRLPYADSFAPETWANGGARDDRPLVPFSAGPAECPGRNLVLLVTSSLLAALLDGRRLRQAHPRPLTAESPLPGTLSPFRLRFEPVPPPGRG